MVVEATRTVIIPLSVPAERRADLHATHDRYEYCQNRTSECCWNKYDREKCITDNNTAEQALYHELREATDDVLHATLVQKAIKDATSAVTSAVERWKNHQRCSQPEWDNDYVWSMAYDKRAATYSRYEASFATVNGRVDCEFILPATLDGTPYEEYILDYRWGFSTSRLVYRDGDFYLHAVMTRTFPESPFDREAVVDEWGFETHDEHHVQVLGVDLNVNGSTAVTSAAGFYGNADSLNHRREHYERVRAGLQETGTRSAHLTIQEFSGREARWVDEYAHSVSNCIVWDALRTGSTHVAFEDLSYIRADIANAKKFQQWLFARIYEYVKYKLVPFGVQVEQIDPENTSKACSYTECGHIAETNRCRKLFECDECSLMLNADYNAARNIGLCLAEEHDQSGRTRSAGRATSQLALKSGTLTPDGGFESHDWVSTDKPTASVVGS